MSGSLNENVSEECSLIDAPLLAVPGAVSARNLGRTAGEKLSPVNDAAYAYIDACIGHASIEKFQCNTKFKSTLQLITLNDDGDRNVPKTCAQ